MTPQAQEEMDKEHGSSFFGNILDRGEQLVMTKLSLLELKALLQVSKLVAGLLQIILLALLALGAFLLLNLAFACVLGDYIGTRYIGFFALAAFYGLLALILTIFRKSMLQTPLSDMLVKRLEKIGVPSDE